ncbi:glutaminase domain-containing protein [Dictyobacter aurantiacus]|nr:DUF5127 domain-containing protein [Dictyobacter aurantiacus]
MVLTHGEAVGKTNGAASGLVGYWPLDDASGNQVADLSGNGYHGELKNGPVWMSGKIGAALAFQGTNTSVDIGQSVLDTSKSFSVAAWVQLSDLSNWHTAVSQDGTNISGFYLQFTQSGQFAFSLVDTDSTSGTTIRATSNFNPVINTWYHLVGVYNASTKQSSLYVNGVLQSTQSVPAAWNAGGTTVIGRARWERDVEFWSGLIDEVRLYNQALGATEIGNLCKSAPMISPIRPPAVPLIVRSPYVNTWQCSDIAPGTWPIFWTGDIKAITGIARIDENVYCFLGSPGINAMEQNQLEITPTQSRYVFQGGGITLYLTFLSPVEATDLKRLSQPFGYILAQAQSNDGATHTVHLYFDISGEWAHGASSTLINWQVQQVAHRTGTLTTFTITPDSPTLLAETKDYPSWGQAVWAANTTANLTYQSGLAPTVRTQFVTQGKLNNSMDTNMPRAINDNWPVFAFHFALGAVNGVASSPLVLTLGHVRQPAASYLGQPLPPLWQAYWSSWQHMLGDFYDDVVGAVNRANALDTHITAAAISANGVHYAALCALATRQAFGGIELVNTAVKPWLFLKNGNISTVDAIYPAFPIFYYLNPTLISLLLSPILTYVESGLWPERFCVHDIGTSYPNAAGHNDGGSGSGKNMPVEESANMLIMAAAHVQRAEADAAATFSQKHYKVLKQWADYLNTPNKDPSRPNALDPLYQYQTDDFTGSIAHSSNLALKGIIAIGAMSKIAKAAGNLADQQFYTDTANSLIKQWQQFSQDPIQAHLNIAYSEFDTPPDTGIGSYSLKYNAFPDTLLDLHLIPSAVAAEEATWYQKMEQAYGIPLDSRHTYTKADWQMWTAAATDVVDLRHFLIDALYHFYQTSPSRVPATDWYDTVTGRQIGFQARPVVGGFFALLARH